MTRPIKFRAWDGKNIVHNQFAISSFGKVHIYEPAREYFGFHDKDWVLMQFTGLTNNGQDWYEGDILENDTDWYQITWDAEGRWEATGIGATGESLALSELLGSETWVQGNIYENGDLLK